MTVTDSSSDCIQALKYLNTEFSRFFTFFNVKMSFTWSLNFNPCIGKGFLQDFRSGKLMLIPRKTSCHCFVYLGWRQFFSSNAPMLLIVSGITVILNKQPQTFGFSFLLLTVKNESVVAKYLESTVGANPLTENRNRVSLSNFLRIGNPTDHYFKTKY